MKETISSDDNLFLVKNQVPQDSKSIAFSTFAAFITFVSLSTKAERLLNNQTDSNTHTTASTKSEDKESKIAMEEQEEDPCLCP